MQTLLCIVASLVLWSQPGAAWRLVYQTDDPFGGVFGVYGYDVNDQQSVAVRFTSPGDYRLAALRLWLWNNEPLGDSIPATVSLHGESGPLSGARSEPADAALESWEFDIPYSGFAQPRLYDFSSRLHTALQSGERYWIVIESDAHPGAVWAVAQPGTGFGAIRFPADGVWRSFEGAIGACEVWAAPVPENGRPAPP